LPPVPAPPPSDPVLPTLTAVPSTTLAGVPVMLAAGAFPATATVLLSVPCCLSLSVAVRLTVYVPLSVGVKLNVDDVPKADWPVLDVTLHAYVSGVSASTPSVTVLPTLTAVPSTTLVGAPVMLAVGAFTVTATVLLPEPS